MTEIKQINLEKRINDIKERISNGFMMSWSDAVKVKVGDVITLKRCCLFRDVIRVEDEEIEILEIYSIIDIDGFNSIVFKGKGLTDGFLYDSRILSVKIPGDVVSKDSECEVGVEDNVKTLYHDDHIVLDTFDGKYRVTFFNEDNHWHGEIVMDETGVIYDSVKNP